MKHVIRILIIVAILAVAGFFGYRYYQNTQIQNTKSYETATIERGRLTAVISATGSVRANQSAVINWMTSGRIDEIKVKAGDKVRQGDELATLAKMSLSQSIILAESDLVSAQRELENLQNSESETAQAYKKMVDAQKELEDATDARQSKDYQRASGESIDSAEATYLMAKNKYEDARDEYNKYADRSEDDPIRAHFLTLMVDAESEMNRALGNLNWLRGGPDATEISQADARVMVAEASLADAQREYDRLKDGADPDDIKAAEARIASIEATLNLAKLEAPFNGTITEVSSKVGDTVSAGTSSFRMDDFSRMLVDVQVTEVDINSIEVGQSATLSFDAILDKEYNGTVVEVSQVGEEIDGLINFKVTIELSDADDQVKPGMTAAVNIMVNELNDVLLVPNRAVRVKEGQHVIYLLKGGIQSEPVSITLGATSDDYSEIISGDVAEGDKAILNPTTTIDFTSGNPMMR